MKSHLELVVNFDSVPSAASAKKSIEPDLEGQKRSMVTLITKGKKLIAKIEAEDIIAMRASINTLLRLISMCEKI